MSEKFSRGSLNNIKPINPCSVVLLQYFSTTTVESKDTSLPWPSNGSLKHVQQYLQNHGIVMTAEHTR